MSKIDITLELFNLAESILDISNTFNFLASLPILNHSLWKDEFLITSDPLNLLVTIDHGLFNISTWSTSGVGFSILNPFSFPKVSVNGPPVSKNAAFMTSGIYPNKPVAYALII